MGANTSKSGGQTPASPVTSHAPQNVNSQGRKEVSVNAHKSTSGPSEPNIRTSSPKSQATTSAQARPSREDSRMGNEQSRHRWRDRGDGRPKEKTTSTPLKVPRSTDPKRQKGPDTQFESSGPPKDLTYIPPRSNLNHPPRLPLPIEEETHTPGSPILTAAGGPSQVREEFDLTGLLPRNNTWASDAETEEDDDVNGLQPLTTEGPSKPVETVIEWKQPGEKVYVTGSFSHWGRKHRMTRNPNTGNLSATLQLIPGTHHVKFIVDGEMQLSNDLPTAVDGTNVLVNYFEVSAEDGNPSSDDTDHRPKQDLPPQTEVKDHDPGSMGKTQQKEPEKPHQPVFWGDGIPFYLRDGDQPENSNRFRRAGRTVEDFPEPPSLPVVLSKSILNSTTPVKDDSSVLYMPNHTLLNHLATSSIKQDVLATSVTTRYKRKYVTTVMYKPTTEA